MAGVIINKLPKFLSEELDEKPQAIIIKNPLNPNESLVILLALKGVTSYFPSRNTRASEYEDEPIHQIDTTSEAPVWEPSKTSFAGQDDAMTAFRGEIISNETITIGQWFMNSLSTSKYHAEDFTDDDNFYKALNAKVNVANVGASKGRHGLTSESLTQK